MQQNEHDLLAGGSIKMNMIYYLDYSTKWTWFSSWKMHHNEHGLIDGKSNKINMNYELEEAKNEHDFLSRICIINKIVN